MNVTSKIEGTGIRSTAATRILFEDLGVNKLISELTESNACLDGLITEVASLQYRLIETGQERDDRVSTLTHNTASRYEFELGSADHEVSKFTQAELDRRTKATLAADDSLQDLDNLIVELRLKLNKAQANFDAEKFRHRTLTNQAGLITASVNFLSASKTARSAALAHLSEL